MDKNTIVNEVGRLGFFSYEDPDFDGMQPFTSGVGRLYVAEKKIGPDRYAGVSFWIHEADQQWFLGLHSPQWFLAKDPNALLDLTIRFLTRQRKITSQTGLSPDIVAEYHLDDWTDIVSNPLARSVILCKALSCSTLEEARGSLNEPPISKQDFVDRTVPQLENVVALPFNGLELSFCKARGSIRFVRDVACLDFHEMLLFANRPGVDLTDDEDRMIHLICDTLPCAAFLPSGPRIT